MDTQKEQQSESPKKTLFTVRNFAQRHEGFLTEGSLRFQIFNADENGLEESGAIVRIGSRVLIDEPKYFDGIESQQTERRA
jgi:hypothetical protein